MMTEEEVEPLISDSGTGSLVSKISVDNSETEEVKNGSDDSGVHRLGSIGDEEALFALIDGNPAGSGNTYERMPDLDEYDFDTSGGIGTGRSMNSKIELNTVNEGITLADRPDTVNEESEFTIQETSVTEEDPDHCMHIDEASHRRDIGKTLNEATVDVQSNTVVSSHKGCTSCQQTDSDTADAEKHPAIKLAVDKTKAVSEISNQKVVSDQESVICAADLSFNIKSGDSIFTEIQEPKAPGSEDEDLINNESVQMSKSAEFSNHSSILSGRDNFSLDLNVSGASGRGYARASDVSMDSDISDSEPEESKSEIATNDLTHTKNHSSSCTSQNIQLSQEQNIGMSKESNNICDNTSSIPHQQLHGDKGSKLNTISEVSSPVPEGNQQKNEVKTKPNKLSRSGNESYMKVKESKSGIYKSSS